MNAKALVPVFKETAQEFGKDKAPRLAAALAYYTLFSLAPLLIIAIAIAGIFYGDEAARGQIVGQLQHILGAKGAAGVQEMIANSDKQKTGIFATIIGTITLLLGASGVFGQLKDALNTIWSVPPKKATGIMGFVKGRFLSLTMVLGVGFLLLVSLVLSAGVAAVGKFMLSGAAEIFVQLATLVLDLVVTTVLFAFLFRYLPDTRVAWRDVWFGAGFTSVMFAIGKVLIGIYLGKSAIASTFGAAASLAIILVWLYYSGLIFFFGAEFTEVYSRARAHAKSGAKEASWRARHADLAPQDELPAAAAVIGDRKVRMPDLPKPASEPAAARSSKGAMAGAGAAGVVVGALATSVGALVVAVKGAKKLFRL